MTITISLGVGLMGKGARSVKVHEWKNTQVEKLEYEIQVYQN